MQSDSNTFTSVEFRPQPPTRLTTPTTPLSPGDIRRDRRPGSQQHNRSMFMWNACDAAVHPTPASILHYDILRARTLDNSQIFPNDLAERLHQHYPHAVQNPIEHSKNTRKLSSALRRSKRRAKSTSVFYDG